MLSQVFVTLLSLSVVVLGILPNALAQSSSGITYQGRILKPNGEPMSGSNVQFRLQIRTPGAQNCLMFEETQVLDMRHSKGLFSLTINDGSGARTDSSGFGLDRIFANRGSFNFDPTTCSTGSTYNPSPDDGRKLLVQFKDESMSSWEPMPPTNINFVPLALDAKHVQGFTPQSLVRVQEADGTMGNIAPLSNANYLDLLNLIGGTSPNYVRASNGAGARVPVVTGNPLSAVAGSVWFDSVSGKLKFHDGSSPVDVGGGAGGGVTEVTAGSGLVTSPGAGITATGSIAIAVGGVVTNMLADGAVTSAKIIDGTIAGSDLAPDITISTTGSVTASGFTTTGNVTVGGDVVVTGGVSATTVTSGTSTTRQIQLFDPDTSSVNKITFTADAALNADYTLKWPLTAGSANQVLSTDGLGNLSWANASSGADNLGNHTATQNIQLGNHWLSGDGSNKGLRIDANGNVGIGGTATPAFAFDVTGAGRFTGTLSIGTTSTTYPLNVNGIIGASSVWLANNGGIAWGNSAGINGNGISDLVTIKTNSIERLRIDTSGHVGIGTASPLSKVHIYDTANADNRLTIGVSGSGNAERARLDIMTLSDSNALGAAGNRGWSVMAHGNGHSLSNHLGLYYWDGTTYSSRLYFGGQNVGVGTTTPQTKLDVNGAVRVGATAVACDNLITGAIRLNATSIEFCNGSAWTALAASGTTTANYLAAGNAGSPGLSISGDTDTGLFAPATDTISLSAGGREGLRVNTAANAVNYISVTPAATTGSPTIAAAGTDANVRLTLSSKGTSPILFRTGGGAQFEILDSASAVNFIGVTGASTTNSPTLYASGADANVDVGLTPKGTGSVTARGSIRSVASATGGSQVNISASNIDWSKSNNQSLSVACTTTTFINMQDGATYNLLVTDTSGSMCAFTHSGLTFLYTPANSPRVGGQPTIYSFTRIGTNVVVSWSTLTP